MQGIEEVIRAMSETETDQLMLVLQDLQDSASPERMAALRGFISTLAREIDEVNRKRDVMGQKISNIDVLLPIIDVRGGPQPDIDVAVLRGLLIAWRDVLRKEVAETRPTQKVDKKYDAERKCDLLANVRGAASDLLLLATGIRREQAKAGPPHVAKFEEPQAKPAPQAHVDHFRRRR